MTTTPTGVWEERWHPLREEWVVVAAHRQNRPWTGAVVQTNETAIPAYQADCYLCPGNTRVSGKTNPHYTHTYVFDNDHPCVGPDANENPQPPNSLYRVRPAQGIAQVICFSPQHNLTLAELPVEHITKVVNVWQKQTYDLGQNPKIDFVLCFENKGNVVGVSNPHPHGQIYATNFVFKHVEQELQASQRYYNNHRRELFEDIIAAEQSDGRRILYEDEHTIAFIPYFARYAYEVYVAPKRRVPHIYALQDDEVRSFAHALKIITVRYDNLWQMSFPYILALHQAPTDGGDYRHHHFFLIFQPPLRTPTLQKFLAGPEVGAGNFISDTAPEAKAAELLAVPTIHYKQRNERGKQ